MHMSAIHIDTHEVKALQLALQEFNWRGIQPNHKAVPAIQKIVRSYVTIISTHPSLIKGKINLEGSGKPRHEWVPVLGDFLRKRVV